MTGTTISSAVITFAASEPPRRYLKGVGTIFSGVERVFVVLAGLLGNQYLLGWRRFHGGSRFPLAATLATFGTNLLTGILFAYPLPVLVLRLGLFSGRRPPGLRSSSLLTHAGTAATLTGTCRHGVAGCRGQEYGNDACQ